MSLGSFHPSIACTIFGKKSYREHYHKAYRLVLFRPVWPLSPRVDDLEPGDGLVRLFPAFARLHLDRVLRRVRREEAPALVTGNQRVPGGCSCSKERGNASAKGR